MEIRAKYDAGDSGLWTKEQILQRKQPIRFAFPGIYFLIRGDEIVYVGQSISNVLNRIVSHTTTKEFDSFSVIHLAGDVDLNEAEAAYIYHLEPHYNGHLPRNTRFFGRSKLKEVLGMEARQISRVIRAKKLRPHLGSYYDIQDFQE